MKEYKVGDRFYHDGVLLEVCESNYFTADCKLCYFNNARCDNNFAGCSWQYFKQVKQDCNCANYKLKRTETRVKQPEALLKTLIDGGWKPELDCDEDLHFIHDTELDFCAGMWKSCGKKSDNLYDWHLSWLEEVEV